MHPARGVPVITKLIHFLEKIILCGLKVHSSTKQAHDTDWREDCDTPYRLQGSPPNLNQQQSEMDGPHRRIRTMPSLMIAITPKQSERNQLLSVCR